MDELRAKCPWDQKQTIASLRYLTIEETYELSESILQNDMDSIKKELGDLMFAVINYARFIGVNPEDALESTNRKFIKRFKYLEEKARGEGRALHEMTLAEMDVYWNEAKSLI